jgi:hypothetical protein
MRLRWLGVALLLAGLGGGPRPAAADPGPALELVGAADPGTAGFNAMAVGRDGYAYLGSWGAGRACPSLGVRVFDVRDPAHPAPMGAVAAYPGTSAEHLAVVRLAEPGFAGTLLLAGIQRCAPASSSPSGLALWDVTDPSAPRELAFFDTGRAGRGVHEFSVGRQGGRWYAYLAVPDSEAQGGPGDLRIVDVTDPAQPTAVADWGARRDAGLPIGRGESCAPVCRGSIPQSFLHSVAVAPDGRTAYLAYWDLGLLILDVSDPAAPVLLGRFREPDSAEGNTHSTGLSPDGSLALVTDETGGPPWGILHLIDVHDPARPTEAGSFATPEAAAATPGRGLAHSSHNAIVDDQDPTRALAAWYADGVRWLDITNPAQPTELAHWLPPSDPMVWSVQPLAAGLLVVGDINNGLFVLARARAGGGA